ncbi:hypothetical protein HOS16_gp47 [Shigella phage vB_SflS-ISF001]|uniref:Uncharacterized protein n=1 Tax=Shigella phage vB_SflS-ISF001 TaxID=2048005 RepID=A0A2D1GQ85_9CAUD|nr:hypothetical protein HOS16_gp47 [Shigella phage vB_SflS-ISF001]ATN94125.1 hypothetical protein FLXISF001_047 [Shigella phage vB_SflS-ISF001]
MFGLTEAVWNVVKRAAKELNKFVSGMKKEVRKNEKIMIDVISTHHKKVQLLIDRSKFVSTAGFIAWRVGNIEGDYE